MAQWIKYLLSKHVDQSLDSHNRGKTLAVILAACNPRTLDVDRGDPWTKLVARISKLFVQWERRCFSKDNLKTLYSSSGLSHAHVLIHIPHTVHPYTLYPRICTHTCAKSHICKITCIFKFNLILSTKEGLCWNVIQHANFLSPPTLKVSLRVWE